MHSIPDQPVNRQPRDFYAGFEIVERESVNAVRVALDTKTGEPARFTFRLGRVPSRRQIVVWHLQGSDPLDRLEAVNAAIAYRRGCPDKAVALPAWNRRKLRDKSGWMFISPLLGTYLDTDVHFEERMRAEFTEPLSLETRITA